MSAGVIKNSNMSQELRLDIPLLLFAFVVLYLSQSTWVQYLSAAVHYWLSGAVDYAAFTTPDAYMFPVNGDDTHYQNIIAILLLSSGVLMPLAMLAVAADAIWGTVNNLATMLYRITAYSLFLFALSYLVLHMFYGGTGQTLGQTALAIYSGSAYSIISMFIIYRLLESYSKNKSRDGRLKSSILQLLFLSCERILSERDLWELT